MVIRSYGDLIEEAKAQQEPQRLLFVFCRAELPNDATAAERNAFDRGEGGALTPVLCVDKTPAEAASFGALVEESQATGQHWDMLFVAAMAGRGGAAPSSEEAEQPLNQMVESIRTGHLGHYLAMTRAGELVDLG